MFLKLVWQSGKRLLAAAPRRPSVGNTRARTAAPVKCVFASICDLTFHHFITPRNCRPVGAGTPLILLWPPWLLAALMKCYWIGVDTYCALLCASLKAEASCWSPHSSPNNPLLFTDGSQICPRLGPPPFLSGCPCWKVGSWHNAWDRELEQVTPVFPPRAVTEAESSRESRDNTFHPLRSSSPFCHTSCGVCIGFRVRFVTRAPASRQERKRNW